MVRMHPIGGLLFAFVGIAVVAAPWMLAARELSHGGVVEPAKVTAPPHAIVWGGRVFSSQAPFAAWLRSRGGSYRVWAARHPDERAVLERTAAPTRNSTAKAARSGSSSKASAPTVTVGAAEHAATSAADGSSSTSLSWLRIALLALASVMIIAALAPVPVLDSSGQALLGATQRAYLFAGGLSVGVGILIASAIS